MDVIFSEHKIRVYAEDVDFMGIVYHANYLRFFERARTELLRERELCLSELGQLNILFAIKELNIKYVMPARLDDLLTITTIVSETTACTLVFDQAIRGQEGSLISEAKVQVVCVDMKLKPKRLPNMIRQ